MKIRDLIESMLKENGLDDEIIVAYWDKNFFIEWHEIDKDKVDKVWKEFVKSGQEALDGHIDFIQTGYDLANDLQEMTEEIE
jgi:SOS response regulatory protein OraA/RecX